MRISSFLLFAFAAVTLCAGCAAPRAPAVGSAGVDVQTQPCKATASQVTVTVMVDAATHSIELDPDPICIKKWNRPITWTFSKSSREDYRFLQQRAFEFKGDSPTFTGAAELQPNGDLVLMFNSIWKAEYSYRLSFVGPGDTRWVCDPTIVNHDNFVGIASVPRTIKCD